MERKHIMRIIIGTMVLVSVALAIWVSQWWLIFTAFIGLNLLQSGVTKWCLLEDILGWLKLGQK
ncbi:DUF2892 domain-containing protein [Candidatus Woesearchaeota archaeon]|nr:DUF2892 domain-containing protein [Candidatus Woesearchaeota archaeon]